MARSWVICKKDAWAPNRSLPTLDVDCTAGGVSTRTWLGDAGKAAVEARERFLGAWGTACGGELGLRDRQSAAAW